MKRKFMFVAMMAAMCSTALFTSCEEENEEGEVAEVCNFADLTAIANSDGTIDISGKITTNTKIKEFALLDKDGNVAYDFLEKNEQVKEKNKTMDENGKSLKSKEFVLDIQSTGKLPVAIYTLVIKTKKSVEITEAIGAEYKFNVGTGSNDQLGSQISLFDQACYMLKDFYDSATGEVNDQAKTIEVYLTEDLKLASAKGLKVATTTNEVRTQAKADANKAKLAAAKVFDNCVITTTECIATYKITVIDDKTVELSGIVINSKGTLKIDTSAVTFE